MMARESVYMGTFSSGIWTRGNGVALRLQKCQKLDVLTKQYTTSEPDDNC